MKRRWKEYQWPVLGGAVLVALGLGYVGFAKYFASLGEHRSAGDLFYLTVQLFSLKSGSVSGPKPWELEVARLLAPFIAAYAVVQALAVVFREQLQLFRVRSIKDHVVICGLGRRGMRIAQKFREGGSRVVVIEQDEENDLIEPCRDQGAIVLIGNATDREFLRRVRVDKAKHLVAVCMDDGVNAEIAVHARELGGNREGDVLTCIVHVVDRQLCHLLREQEIGAGRTDDFRLEFFNVFDNGARAWLKEHPPFDEKEAARGRLPHILLIGAGRLGGSLVVHAAKQWRYLDPPPGGKLRITILDKEAKRKTESLCLRYPQLENVCQLTSREMTIESPEFERADFLFDDRGRCDVTSVFVCMDDDSLGLSAALSLHHHMREEKIPIVVRMTHDAGLATLLHGKGETHFAGLRPFGLLDRTCEPELLLGGTNETLARAIQEEYVRMQEKEGKTPETNPSMVFWEDLPENLKNSNRRQADDIGRKLKGFGFGILPQTDWDEKLFEFTEEDKEKIEQMARMEHKRWMSERIKDGWRHDPGPKDLLKKTSPSLVPWDELPPEIRELDLNTILGLPRFLAKADFRIYRLKRLGPPS